MALDENIDINLKFSAKLDTLNKNLENSIVVMQSFETAFTKSFASLVDGISGVASSIDTTLAQVAGGFADIKKNLPAKQIKALATELKDVNKELGDKLSLGNLIRDMQLFQAGAETMVNALKGGLEATEAAFFSFANNVKASFSFSTAALNKNVQALRSAANELETIFREQDAAQKKTAGKSRRKVLTTDVDPSDLTDTQKKIQDFYKGLADVSKASPFFSQLEATKVVATQFVSEFEKAFAELPTRLEANFATLTTELNTFYNSFRTFSRRITGVENQIENALETEKGAGFIDRLNLLTRNINDFNTSLKASIDPVKATLKEFREQVKDALVDIKINVQLPNAGEINMFSRASENLVKVLKNLAEISPQTSTVTKQLPSIANSIVKFQSAFTKLSQDDRAVRSGPLVATFGEIKAALSNLPEITQYLNSPINTDSVDSLVEGLRKFSRLPTDALLTKFAAIKDQLSPALVTFSKAIKDIPTTTEGQFDGIANSIKKFSELGKQSGSINQSRDVVNKFVESLILVSGYVDQFKGGNASQLSSFINGITKAANNLSSLNLDASKATELKDYILAVIDAIKTLDESAVKAFNTLVSQLSRSLDILIDIAENKDFSSIVTLGYDLSHFVSQLVQLSTSAGQVQDLSNLVTALNQVNSAIGVANRSTSALAKLISANYTTNIHLLFQAFASLSTVPSTVISSAVNISTVVTTISTAFQNFSLPSAGLINRLSAFLTAISGSASRLTVPANFSTSITDFIDGINLLVSSAGTINTAASLSFGAITLPTITAPRFQTVRNFQRIVTVLVTALQDFVTNLGPLAPQLPPLTAELNTFATAFNTLVTALNTIRSSRNLSTRITNITNALSAAIPQLSALATPGTFQNINDLASAIDNLANSLNNLGTAQSRVNPRTIQSLGNARNRSGGGGVGGDENGRFLGVFDRVNEILPSRGPIVQFTGLLFLLEGAFAGVVRAFDNFQNAVVGANVELEQITVTLSTTLGTVEQAGVAVNQFARRFAAEVPFFEFKDITQAIALLSAEGFTLSKLTGDLEKQGTEKFAGSLVAELADMAAAFGTSLESSVDSFISAVQGRFVKIRKFGISESLLQQFGFTGLRSDAEGLANSLERIIKVRFGGLTKTLSATFRGAVSNIQDLFGVIKTNAFKGIFEVVRDNLVSVAEALSDLTNTASARGKQFNKALTGISGTLAKFTQFSIRAVKQLYAFKEVLIALVAIPVGGLIGTAGIYAFQRITESILNFAGAIRGPGGGIAVVEQFIGVLNNTGTRVFTNLSASLGGLTGAYQTLIRTIATANGAATGTIGVFAATAAYFRNFSTVIFNGLLAPLALIQGSITAIGLAFAAVFRAIALPLIIQSVAAIDDIRKGLDTVRARAFKQFIDELKVTGQIATEIFNDIGEAVSLIFNTGTYRSGVIGFATTVTSALNKFLSVIRDIVVTATNYMTEFTRVLNVALLTTLAIATNFVGLFALLIPQVREVFSNLKAAMFRGVDPLKTTMGTIKKAIARDLDETFADLDVKVNFEGLLDPNKVATMFSKSVSGGILSSAFISVVGAALSAAIGSIISIYLVPLLTAALPAVLAELSVPIATWVASWATGPIGAAVVAAAAILGGLFVSNFIKQGEVEKLFESTFQEFEGFTDEAKKIIVKAGADFNLFEALANKETDPKRALEAIGATLGTIYEGIDRIRSEEGLLPKGVNLSILQLQKMINYLQITYDKTKLTSELFNDPKFFAPKEVQSLADAIVGTDKEFDKKAAYIEKTVQDAVNKLDRLQTSRSEAILNNDIAAADEYSKKIDLLSANILQGRSEALSKLIDIRKEALKLFSNIEAEVKRENIVLEDNYRKSFEKIANEAKETGVSITESLTEELIKGTNFKEAVDQLKSLNESVDPSVFTEFLKIIKTARDSFRQQKSTVDELTKAQTKTSESINNLEKQTASHTKSMQNFIEVTYEEIDADREVGKSSAKAALERTIALTRIIEKTKELSDNTELQREKVRKLNAVVSDYVKSLDSVQNRQKALGRVSLAQDVVAAARGLKETLKVYKLLGDNVKNLSEFQDDLTSKYDRFRESINALQDSNRENISNLTETANTLNNIRSLLENVAKQDVDISKALEGFNVSRDSLSALKDSVSSIREIADLNASIASFEFNKRTQETKLAYLYEQMSVLKEIEKTTGITGFNEDQLIKLEKEALDIYKEKITAEKDRRTELLKTRQDYQIQLQELAKKELDLIKEQDKLVESINDKRRKGAETQISLQEKLISTITNSGLPANLQRTFALARLNLTERYLGTVKDGEKRQQLLGEYLDGLASARKEQLLTQTEFNDKAVFATKQLKSIDLTDLSQDIRDDVERLSNVNDELSTTEQIMKNISKVIDTLSSQLSKLSADINNDFISIAGILKDLRKDAAKDLINLSEAIKGVFKEKGLDISLSNESIAVLVQIARAMDGAKNIEEFRKLAEKMKSIFETEKVAGNVATPQGAGGNQGRQGTSPATNEKVFPISEVSESFNTLKDLLNRLQNTLSERMSSPTSTVSSSETILRGIRELRGTIKTAEVVGGITQSEFNKLYNDYTSLKNRLDALTTKTNVDISTVTVPSSWQGILERAVSQGQGRTFGPVATATAEFRPDNLQAVNTISNTVTRLSDLIVNGLRDVGFNTREGILNGFNDFFNTRPLQQATSFSDSNLPKVETSQSEDIKEIVRLLGNVLTENNRNSSNVISNLENIVKKDLDINVNLVAEIPPENVNALGNDMVNKIVRLVLDKLQLKENEEQSSIR